MSNTLKKYFSKPKSELEKVKNDTEKSSGLNPEVKGEIENFSTKVKNVVTDVGANTFGNLYPQYEDIIGGINSHKVIAKKLCENLENDEIKDILKNKLVDSSIKFNIISKVYKTKKFLLDNNFLNEMKSNILDYKVENNVRILFLKNSKKGVYIFPNNLVKSGKVIGKENDKGKKEVIFNFEDGTKITHKGRVLDTNLK